MNIVYICRFVDICNFRKWTRKSGILSTVWGKTTYLIPYVLGENSFFFDISLQLGNNFGRAGNLRILKGSRKICGNDFRKWEISEFFLYNLY